MGDVAFLTVAIAFFVLSVAYTAFCDRKVR
jgi:hypothetical protein